MTVAAVAIDDCRMVGQMDPHRDGGGGPTAEVSTMLNQYLKTTIKCVMTPPGRDEAKC